MLHFTCATGSGCEHPGTIPPEQWQEHSVSVASSAHSCFISPMCLFPYPSLLPLLSLRVILPFPFRKAKGKLIAARERNLPTGCYQSELTNHFPWSHSSRAIPEGHCLSVNVDLWNFWPCHFSSGSVETYNRILGVLLCYYFLGLSP